MDASSARVRIRSGPEDQLRFGQHSPPVRVVMVRARRNGRKLGRRGPATKPLMHLCDSFPYSRGLGVGRRISLTQEKAQQCLARISIRFRVNIRLPLCALGADFLPAGLLRTLRAASPFARPALVRVLTSCPPRPTRGPVPAASTPRAPPLSSARAASAAAPATAGPRWLHTPSSSPSATAAH
jgi:hypothetical protein